MSERFRLVQIQEIDVAHRGLLAQELQTDTAARNGLGVLPADQRVARPAPAIAILRRRTESQPADTRTSPRRAISAHSRDSVQCWSWVSSSAKISWASAKARWPSVPGRPPEGAR